MKRAVAVKKQILSFRERAETLIALARQLEQMQYKDRNDKLAQQVLLVDAQKLVAVVQKVMRKSDDVRTWAHDVFGDEIDGAGIVQFAGKIMTNSVNAAIGFQTYRIRKFLKSGTLERTPNVAGTLLASGIANLLNEVTR